MKITKITTSQIQFLREVLEEIDDLAGMIFMFGIGENQFEEYKHLGQFKISNADHALEAICQLVSKSHYDLAIDNLNTLLDNCADRDSDTLEFCPKISEANQVIEMLDRLPEGYYVSRYDLNPENERYGIWNNISGIKENVYGPTAHKCLKSFFEFMYKDDQS